MTSGSWHNGQTAEVTSEPHFALREFRLNLKHRNHSTESASTSPATSGDSGPRPRVTGRGVLFAAIVVFTVLRLPVLLHAPGGQDEEWYAVPGLTIAQQGVPRVPYSRASEPGSVFRGADEMLFAQPPLSFYAQAPFFLVLEDNYATARLASFLAGCFSIGLTFAIAQRLTGDARIASGAAVLYSLSRLCFFPAVVARPDMICGMLGLASVLMMLAWQSTRRHRSLVFAGIAVGLSALTHPFAIVFGIQTTLWVLLTSGTIAQRFWRLSILTVSIAMTFALWLPLIAMRPDLFRSQFIGNILRPAGPGLVARAIMPWESLANQIPQLIERAHPIQFGMLAAGLVFALGLGCKTRRPAILQLVTLAITSVYLLVVCLGVHPIQGFWCYSAALSWICVALAIVHVLDLVARWKSAHRIALGTVVILVLAAMIPGSGFRTTLAYAKHWNDNDYMSSRFIKRVLADVPDDASITVGPEFALDVYARGGREVVLACKHPMYFDSTRYPTKYYLFGRRDFAEGFPAGYDCTLVRSYGIRDDIFANYVELYRSNVQSIE